MNDSKAVRITKGVLALALLVPVAFGLALGVSISSPLVGLIALAFSIYPLAIIHEAVRNRPLFRERRVADDHSLYGDAVGRDRDFWTHYDPSNPASPAGIHRRNQDELRERMNDTLQHQHGIV